MKKTFTVLGLVFLAMQMNAQSTVALNENFEDQEIDASLVSKNPSALVNTETESGFAMTLQYNSVDIPYVGLDFSLNRNVLASDSISVTYEVDIVNMGGGFDGGSNSVFYTDMVSVPFSFGEKILDYSLYMTGQDFDVIEVIFDGGKAYVTKGFSNPFQNPLSLINFDFQKTYLLGSYTASSPELLAATACKAEFTNPNEIVICTQQVIANAPSIQGSLLVDNILISTHTITGIEEELAKESSIVKAFNFSGKEVAIDTRNQALILIYSDGRAERVFIK